MINNLAPIALFVYNRPDHTARTLEALQKNNLASESDLFIFCDGPKNENALEKIKKVHKIIDNISGFRSVQVEKNNSNKGLANSIISGVSKVVNQYGKIIVIEDDLVTSPYFLEYMNDGLAFYKNDEEVISIHGYIYPLKAELLETFFLKGADCWGWATWKRGWDLFNPDGAQLLRQLKERNLENEFDFDGCYGYTQMLEDQITGKNNSWAIRWHASAFLAGKLTLYPGKSLVQNIGFDDSGTHCGTSEDYGQQVFQDKIVVTKIDVKQDIKVKNEIKNYFKPKKNILSKIKDKISRKIIKKRNKKLRKQYGWFSTNLDWKNIEETNNGYAAEAILERCKTSLLKVKNGEAVYERDSVLFNKVEYSWPILSSILWAFSVTKNHSILDFGGSLGSSYYQNRKFLSIFKDLKWGVVEQKNFVDAGKKYFTDDNLSFFYDVQACVNANKPSVLLLSSVLQYLEDPYKFIAEIKKYNFEFILIDRVGFIDNVQDVLTIQKVPPEIYEASYPCWFFNKKNLLDSFIDNYEIIAEFNSEFDQNIVIDRVRKADYQGFILKIRDLK